MNQIIPKLQPKTQIKYLSYEIDDSEDLEKHMKLLNDNKIARRKNVFCYTWSELKIYNKKLGELK